MQKAKLKMQKRLRWITLFCILPFAFCILAGCHRAPALPVEIAEKPAAPQIWGGQKGQQAGQFYEPRALAVAPNHFVYAVDSSGYVQKWTDKGKFIKRWRVPSIDKGRPEGLAVTKSGNIAVCDTHYSVIRIYSPEGKLLRSFGTYGPQKGGFLLSNRHLRG